MKKKNSQDDLKVSMIESLLHSAYDNEVQENESRINAVLAQIASTENATTSLKKRTINRGAIRWRGWASIAAALAVLMVLSFVFQPSGSSAQAMSAIERSIAAAKKSISRKYRLVITRRATGNSTREIESDLFVKGSDRIAIRYPHPLFNKSYWLGNDGNESWLVPPLGPVRIGNQSEFGQWLSRQENISTPYLHSETLLLKMRIGYQLDEQAEKVLTLVGGETHSCRHIIATFRGNKSSPKNKTSQGNRNGKRAERPPATIELWLDTETEIAIRVDARWDKQTHTWGRERVVIEYVTEPTLSENWFSAEAHYSGIRRKLRFNEN